MTIGNIICELRKEKNISQQKLADSIGVNQATIAKIEVNRNEATAATIRKLATYFDVSADYLLGLENDYGAKIAGTVPATADAMGDTLTSEERKLVEVYNSLSPDMQQTLWSLLSTWAPSIATKKQT